MKNRRKSLICSMLALCICTMLIVGGTYALFTDNVTVNNHLEAGNLDVGLHRISYKEWVLDTNGLMTEKSNDTDINLADDATELFNVTKVVPTSWYQATMKVSNEGSTAFDYTVCVLWTDTNVGDEEYYKDDEVLAAQIKITITSKNISDEIADGKVTVTDENGGNPEEVNYVTFMLDKCNLEENKISLGYILAGEADETFTVKAEFIDTDYEINNLAMDAQLKFDVQVFATQKTTLD